MSDMKTERGKPLPYDTIELRYDRSIAATVIDTVYLYGYLHLYL